MAMNERQAEIIRLCGYLKNDSLIRWATGCTQAEVDAGREAAKRGRPISTLYLGPEAAKSDPDYELRIRTKRAALANKRYLAALKKAGANG